MTDAREIIADAIDYPKATVGTALPDECITDWQVRAVQQALTSAGFRILRPDEIDQLCEDIQVAVSSMTGDCKAHHKIALNHMDRALRALKEKRT